jgi:glycogen debranching enzyme
VVREVRSAFARHGLQEPIVLISDDSHDDTRMIRKFTPRMVNNKGKTISYTSSSTSSPSDGSVFWTITSEDGAILHYHSFVCERRWYHKATLIKEGTETSLSLAIDFEVAADDMFEVRKALLPWDREFKQDTINDCATSWTYFGKDNSIRGVSLYDHTPLTSSGDMHSFSIPLKAGQEHSFCFSALHISAEKFDSYKNLEDTPLPYNEALHQRKERFEDFRKGFNLPANMPPIITAWVNKGIEDMFLLQGKVDGRPCIQAGIPWFATLFGRDSLITAEQTLDVAPFLARNTLDTLAAFQAQKNDPLIDAQPGKILHEMRFCERANLRHIPFGRYYGTVDATPLFISLTRRYFDRTKDSDFLTKFLPHFDAAVSWLERELKDQTFLTYADNPEEGEHRCRDKGWKDGALVLHKDGTTASHPMALCEVQGYAYRALRDAADIFEQITPQNTNRVEQLRHRAGRLKQDFNERFWMDDLGTFAMGIDGDGKQCQIITSNPGHLFRCNIISDSRKLERVVHTFVEKRHLFSGWGIRTLSASDKSYAPASYQLGGVWPHDTCEALRGLLSIGQIDAAKTIFSGLLDFAKACEFRLPELITGYPKNGDKPEVYADTCSPQAWSASIPFSLLSSSDRLWK